MGSLAMTYDLAPSIFFFFKQKTAYEMRISDWSSDVCSSDLDMRVAKGRQDQAAAHIDDAGGRSPQRADLGLAADRDDPAVLNRDRFGPGLPEIGRASCRERVCQYV